MSFLREDVWGDGQQECSRTEGALSGDGDGTKGFSGGGNEVLTRGYIVKITKFDQN